MTKRPVVAVLLLTLLTAPALLPMAAAQGRNLPLDPTVTVRAAAVAQTPEGLVGSTARIEVTTARNGSGHVFMDTVPLAAVDMQGSARLAVRVAAGLTGLPRERYDVFFVVRSDSPIIGGPSAGAVMTVATVAAIKGWTVDPRVMMTGTVNPDGSVGPVGGIPEKAEAAWEAGARLFLFPQGQADARTGEGGVVHLPTWCEEEVGLTCRPVADVTEAVRAMTGHAFQEPAVPGNVSTEDYRAIMAPLAADLLERANRTIQDADDALSESTELPPGTEEELRTQLEDARSVRDDAVAARDEEQYYAAASRAFQASIGGRTILEAVTHLEAGDPDTHADERFDAVLGSVEEAKKAAGAAAPHGLSELQAVAAAQTRALEAERVLEEARVAYQEAATTGEVVAALAQLAFAAERAETVHWWLRIGDHFAKGGPVNPTELEMVRQETLSTTRETLAYARVILEETGAGTDRLGPAEDLLASAERAEEEGYLPAAIFDALQAETRASVALETLAVSDLAELQERRDRSRHQAAVAIAESRELGVEPILAVAYFEFAGRLENPVDALSFYGSARTISRASHLLLGKPPAPRASRFVGPDPAVSGPLLALEDSLALFAVSLALGAGLALAATGLPEARRGRGPRRGGRP